MTDDRTLTERIEAALHFRAHSDVKVAELKRDMLKAEEKHKQIQAAHFKTLRKSDGKISVEDAKQQARVKAEPAFIEYLTAAFEHDKLANQRKTAEINIDALRSLMADRRRGNVT